jgi:hypothetical protein
MVATPRTNSVGGHGEKTVKRPVLDGQRRGALELQYQLQQLLIANSIR